jgi:hypothetical protein
LLVVERREGAAQVLLLIFLAQELLILVVAVEVLEPREAQQPQLVLGVRAVAVMAEIKTHQLPQLRAR